MPIPGTVWTITTWNEDAWAADTWADSIEAVVYVEVLAVSINSGILEILGVIVGDGIPIFSKSVKSIIKLTQAEYDAITPSTTTVYIISG